MGTAPSATSRRKVISSFIARWFPTPQLFFPRAAGIDISDASIKWLMLAPPDQEECVTSYGEELLPGGTVVNGVVQSASALAATLENVKKKGALVAAHAALPEEAAYVFSMQVPAESTREQINNMIESLEI